MFCSFARIPRILWFFFMGTVVEWDEPKFEGLLKKMGKERIAGARAVILLDVFKVCAAVGSRLDLYGLLCTGTNVLWLRRTSLDDSTIVQG